VIRGFAISTRPWQRPFDPARAGRLPTADERGPEEICPAMPILRFLPLLLLLWPIVEIAVFIWVGGRIGLLWTLALIILAGVVGTALVRIQGLGLIRSIRADLDAGRLPADSILHGALVAVAGVLLVVPGFLSDIPGFLLLLPPVRAMLVRVMRANATVVTTYAGTARRRGPAQGVVDLDPEDYARRGDGASPWSGPGDPPALDRR
jgi:UPF0716 protein FxsA